MEIDEIKNCWKEEDKRISENVRINRNVSFRKLHSAFEKVRIRRLLRLVQMCIFVPLILVLIVLPRLKNDGSALFYLGFVSFIIPVLFFFIYAIYYYICLLKIDFTVSLVKAKMEILRLERIDKRLNLSRFVIVPVVTFSVFKIFGIPLGQEAVIMLALIGLTMIAGFIKRKGLIPKEYGKLKSSWEELEEDEKTD
ncbi:MAG: hypothetical protein LBU37_04570 [Tannerellaceae bacterium]|nr:hypothetical protein [Tannerellaceae bacterium]